MASMFRSPEDISSSNSSSSSDGAYEDENQPFQTQDPLGESPIESIGPGTTMPAVASSTVEDDVSYDEVTTGTPHDHGAVLDLDADGHASLMTAALLEFYCKSRALEILNRRGGTQGTFTQDSPEVQMLGKRLYEYKSRFLSSHGVIPNGIDGDDWDTARQYYRDSLDTLGLTALETLQLDPSQPHSPANGITAHQPSSPKAASRQLGRIGLQRRITDREDVAPVLQGPPPNFTSLLHLPNPAPASIPLLRQPSSNATLQSSRYAAEFKEIKLIGKGSFGSVYHVSNHVDGQNYAVKKIPISGRRLRQFHDGIRDLENLLKEIRTLARLDHLNIVRYFGAWVEHSASPVTPNDGTVPTEFPLQPLLSQDPADEDEPETGVVLEEYSDGIVFEDSSRPADPIEGTDPPSSSTIASAPSRKSRSSRSLGNWEEDDDDVESIPRQFSIPSEEPTTTVSGTDQDIFTDDMGENMSNMQIGRRGHAGEPVITLHIQMSLHPISLATYLSPMSRNGAGQQQQSSPRHCFHVVPSLKLLLGILSGVEYLHAKGIVHRDLKPGNIFLSPCDITAHVCPSCDDTVTGMPRYTIPRIGDFGLVAEISEYGEQTSSNAQPGSHSPNHPRPHDQRVGTEFYRPPLFNPPPPPKPSGENRYHPKLDDAANHTRKHRSSSASYINEKLDVFALGVILFELLYKLDTRMERQLVLFDLTRAPNPRSGPQGPKDTNPSAALPADFKDKLDDLADLGGGVSSSLVACIQGMLEPDPEKRWSCKYVRKCLEEVLGTSEANSPTETTNRD
ncbi:hypothetical protein FQN54_007976 [Arachnomyces sp. PD_36]|nr:hypothetical protein FQN54_007976 [Arachnomyces sp. PD_36]